jgi:hypothetical protein
LSIAASGYASSFIFHSLELVSADIWGVCVNRFSTLSPHSMCYQSRASLSWMPFFHISRFAFIFLRLRVFLAVSADLDADRAYTRRWSSSSSFYESPRRSRLRNVLRACTCTCQIPHTMQRWRRIPMSILYPQNEETHTDSDKTALPSPALHPMNKQ